MWAANTGQLPRPARFGSGWDLEQRGPGSQWQRGSAGKPPISARRTHLRGQSTALARVPNTAKESSLTSLMPMETAILFCESSEAHTNFCRRN